MASHLRCPNCGRSLIPADHALGCVTGHRFDVSRHGHVTLLAPGTSLRHGDTADMVAARARFLHAGHYSPIAAAVAEAAIHEVAGPNAASDGIREVGSRTPRVPIIVDVGAGSGYYLAALLRGLPDARGIALDASRPALRHAVRSDPGVAAVVCDVWQEIPVQSGAADLVINVFAPRNAAEIARVLAAHGSLVVVTPTARHLTELIPVLGMLRVDPGKSERLRAALSGHFRGAGRRLVEFEVRLDRNDARALVAMGPSAYHVDSDDLDRGVAGLPEPFGATASVTVEVFRPLPASDHAAVSRSDRTQPG